jgi:hypothetical protein
MSTAADIRATVKARMIAMHGGEEGAQRALAHLLAPVWGVKWKSAESRLIRWFSGEQDMASEAFCALLSVLGLGICDMAA